MKELKNRIPEEDTILEILLETREKASGLSNLTDRFFIPGQSVDEIAKLKLKTRIDNIDKLLEISDQEFARIFKAGEIAAADLTKEQVGQGMSKIARSCKEITFDDRLLRPHYPNLKIKDIQVALNKVVTEKKIDPEVAANIYKESIVPVLIKQLTENLDKVPAEKACDEYNNFCQILQKQVKPTSKS